MCLSWFSWRYHICCFINGYGLHFQENNNFVSFGKFEWLIILQHECSFSRGRWINSEIHSMNKIPPVTHALAGHTSSHTYAHKYRQHFEKSLIQIQGSWKCVIQSKSKDRYVSQSQYPLIHIQKSKNLFHLPLCSHRWTRVFYCCVLRTQFDFTSFYIYFKNVYWTKILTTPNCLVDLAFCPSWEYISVVGLVDCKEKYSHPGQTPGTSGTGNTNN